MLVLTVNAGSSTLKLSLLDDDKPADEQVLARRLVEVPDPAASERALRDALAELGRPDAVAHRVVHGGSDFTSAVRMDAAVRSRLGELVDLAPLHQPAALAGIDAIAKVLPDVPAVACFDTAFHSTLPPAARTYAIPREWRERYGLRRYGFHGLSHAYATWQAGQLLRRPVDGLRLVVCHLGAGASLCAVRDGRSVDTTMGFTPLEGLVMATRSGDVDPGLLLWVQRHAGLDVDQLDEMLNHQSGMAALAGTGDMRVLHESLATGDERAALALDVYVHRLRKAIAGMVASLERLDALVFTAGVGERDPVVRARTADGLGFLGVAVDAERNADARPDVDLAPPDAPVRCLVIEAREDLQMVSETRRLLDS